jgi:hypothetical protein
MLYELASLRRAFDGGSLPALVVKILRGRYPPLPSRYSPQLRGLVDALLQQDPQVNSTAGCNLDGQMKLTSDGTAVYLRKEAAGAVLAGVHVLCSRD